QARWRRGREPHGRGDPGYDRRLQGFDGSRSGGDRPVLEEHPGREEQDRPVSTLYARAVPSTTGGIMNRRHVRAGIVLGTLTALAFSGCAGSVSAPKMSAAEIVAERQRVMKLNGAS